MLLALSIITLHTTTYNIHCCYPLSTNYNATYNFSIFLIYIGILFCYHRYYFTMKLEIKKISTDRRRPLLTECNHKVIFRFHANNNSPSFFFLLLLFILIQVFSLLNHFVRQDVIFFKIIFIIYFNKKREIFYEKIDYLLLR